ncbi:MAG TPA: hypothetical protein VIL86_04905 [Tepidisphaeraceae bacterium]|jgi:hypothetical protein
MTETATASKPLDLALIDDPNVRRVLRQLHQDFRAEIDRQQFEIESLLELMIEKRIASIGEFKLHLTRLRQGTGLHDRIHDALAAATPPVHRAIR